MNQACQKCPKGKKGVELGGSSDAACIDCKSGSYTSVPGESSCVLCDKGKYGSNLTSLIRDDEATSCTPCPVNTFSGAFGAASSVVSCR